jgi:HEAT repeat protein
LQRGETEEVLSADVYYGLSDLTDREIATLRPAWQKLDDDYRLKIMQRLAETSEVNYDIDYRAFGLFGLEDSSPEVRQTAIEVLWADESLELMDRLIAVAQRDDNTEVRAAALTDLGRFILLGELGDLPESKTVKAQNIALKLYNDLTQPVDVRRRALEAIANCGHDSVTNAIKQAYRSSNRQMQISAVFAMGRTCDEQWEDIVLQELQSEDAEMRYEAARAAGELELLDAVPALSQLVFEEDREISEMAVWSLGEIGGREALRVLNAAMEQAEAAADEEMIEAVEDAIGNASLAGGGMFSVWSDN